MQKKVAFQWLFCRTLNIKITMKILALPAATAVVLSINNWCRTYWLILPTPKHSLMDLNDYEMPISVLIGNQRWNTCCSAWLCSKIDETDLICVFFGEHNGAYTAAFKNILIGASRIFRRKVWNDKPMFVMATSTGARGGSSVLEIATTRMPFNGGKVLEKFSPSFNNNFSIEMASLMSN